VRNDSDLADLVELGWDDFFQQQLSDEERREKSVGRVIEEQKRYVFVATGAGTLLARPSGKMRHAARERDDLPAVGDWAVISARGAEGTGTLERILGRRSRLSRKASGAEEEQILCTNVDVAFIVQGLDQPPNLRRLERFVAMARAGGVAPVILLSKADVAAVSVEAALAEVKTISGDTPISSLSVKDGRGTDAARGYLTAGRTAVVVGPSGSGKSTLINHLAGEERQSVGEVRGADAKGRHTTTARTMVRLPGGALIVDTPGIRELEVWGAEAGLADTFQEIEHVAFGCKFRDCAHQSEPGCAVLDAVLRGAITQARLDAFTKLRAEAAARARKLKLSKR
jgi:ribosome biogenesis GTPase